MTSKTRYAYRLIVEKPYCCVPATIQMILERRGLPYETQENIGEHLGLIVPPAVAPQFTSVRTGPEPPAGYGTQISKSEFSIEAYFDRQNIPVAIELIKPSNLEELESIINNAISNDIDMAICYDSIKLFNEGDKEHFSIVQSIDNNGNLYIIDPAIGAPPMRKTTIKKLFEVLQSHNISKIGGIWLFSSHPGTYPQCFD